MIQNLILQLIDLLVEVLASLIPQTAQQIQAGPFTPANNANLPLIVLTAGNLSISQPPGEGTSTSPRPEALRQKLAVSQISPLGPYVLTKTPLKGSVQCQVFFNEGKVSERQVWLQENQDFTINYNTKECSFIDDISQADSIFLIYSFVSIFSLRNFVQELFIDVYASNLGELEKFISLSTGAIVTHHDHLLEAYNQDTAHKTEYNSGTVGTVHQLNQIQFLDGKPDYNSPIKMRLKFMVYGHIKATREISEGFGIIEKIHSLNRLSNQPIDISIMVE